VDLSNLSLDNLPDMSSLPTTALEHGTAYKFRIAAVNSCGRGEFSEVSVSNPSNTIEKMLKKIY
jgi:host cell factor